MGLIDEKPFENCDEQHKSFTDCMTSEKRRYIHDGQNRTMNQQIEFMLEKKRKEKLMNTELKKDFSIAKENNVIEKEYFVRNTQEEKEVKMDQKI